MDSTSTAQARKATSPVSDHAECIHASHSQRSRLSANFLEGLRPAYASQPLARLPVTTQEILLDCRHFASHTLKPGTLFAQSDAQRKTRLSHRMLDKAASWLCIVHTLVHTCCSHAMDVRALRMLAGASTPPIAAPPPWHQLDGWGVYYLSAAVVDLSEP